MWLVCSAYLSACVIERVCTRVCKTECECVCLNQGTILCVYTM